MLAKTLQAAGALALAVLAPAAPAAAMQTLAFTGGTVVDGSGAPGRIADIVTQDGQIVFVGALDESGLTPDRVIAANGLVVAPGFIDPHTHALADLAAEEADRRRSDNILFQGVTTVVVGNDGGGEPAVGSLAEDLQARGIGPNVGFLVGLGPIRTAVIGEENRTATAGELARMEAMLAGGMCEGAIGFSTGLHYTPQNFAPLDEVVALATVAAARGGLYDSHIRDESSYSQGLVASIEEAITVGQRSGAPVHIAHIKALGPDVWGQSEAVIARVEAARANGLRVTADQYPWRASGTRLANALVPRWALDGGREGLLARLDDPEVRPRLVAEMHDNLRRRAGADALLLTRPLRGADPALGGHTLAAIAEQRGEDAVETAIAIIRSGGYRVASFVMDGADIEAFAGQDWVMTASDGSTGHPRRFATFPKAYRDLVVDGAMMSLERFVRRSTGLTADTFGFTGRGYLREGYIADIVVFDPQSFAPRAGYAAPEELSEGVRYLLVNGVLAIENGSTTGALAGQPVLRDTSHIDLCEE